MKISGVLVVAAMAVGFVGGMAWRKTDSTPAPSPRVAAASQTVLCATSCASVVATPVSRPAVIASTSIDDKVALADAAALDKLDKLVGPVHLKGTFADAISQFAKLADVEVEVNWPLLNDRDSQCADCQVCVVVPQVSARTLLEALLLQPPMFDFGWDVRDGKVRISSAIDQEFLKGAVYTREYSCNLGGSLPPTVEEWANRAQMVMKICGWLWNDGEISQVISTTMPVAEDILPQIKFVVRQTARNQRQFEEVLNTVVGGTSAEKWQQMEDWQKKLENIPVRDVKFKDASLGEIAAWFATNYNLPIIAKNNIGNIKFDYELKRGFALEALREIGDITPFAGGQLCCLSSKSENLSPMELVVVPIDANVSQIVFPFTRHLRDSDSRDRLNPKVVAHMLADVKKYFVRISMDDKAFSNGDAIAQEGERRGIRIELDWPKAVYCLMPCEDLVRMKQRLDSGENEWMGVSPKPRKINYVKLPADAMQYDEFFRRFDTPIKQFEVNCSQPEAIEKLAKAAGLPLDMDKEFAEKRTKTNVKLRLDGLTPYEILQIIPRNPAAKLSDVTEDASSLAFKWDVYMGKLVICLPESRIEPEAVDFNRSEYVASLLKGGMLKDYLPSKVTPLLRNKILREDAVLLNGMASYFWENSAQERLKKIILKNVSLKNVSLKDILDYIFDSLGDERNLVMLDQTSLINNGISVWTTITLTKDTYDLISAWDLLLVVVDGINATFKKYANSERIVLCPIVGRKICLLTGYSDMRLNSELQMAYFELSQNYADQYEKESKNSEDHRILAIDYDLFRKMQNAVLANPGDGEHLWFRWLEPYSFVVEADYPTLLKVRDFVQSMEAKAAAMAATQPTSGPAVTKATTLPAGLPVLSEASPAARERFLKTADTKGAVAAMNELAFDLYAKLAAEEKGNFIFSPYGVDSCLAMLLPGAKGQTHDQLAKALRIIMDDAQAIQARVSLMYKLDATPSELIQPKKEKGDGLFAPPNETTEDFNKGARYTLALANALWITDKYKINDSYLAMHRELFGSTIQRADFAGDPAKAAGDINAWASKKTGGMIDSVVSPGDFDALTALVLANAIYFKAAWMGEFNENKTVDDDFRLTEKNSVKCKMMQQNSRMMAWDGDDVKMLRMCYDYDWARMEIVLPDAVDGLAKVEKDFAKIVADANKGIKEYEVDLFLPKFKFESMYDLIPVMKSLGVTDLFGAQADLTGIMPPVDGMPLYVEVFRQKAAIAVDEKGTEASAASVGIGCIFGEPPPPPPVPHMTFDADHPFVFIIRDTKTDAILFIGRVCDPTNGKK